ncbi:MAG: thiamine pyrophosphate-binding protein, partial [Candidatus Thermoplasmatota archaeon]|nr:thiamine pyrophosphate-binding protein [Candidatus Thermoplasmatota archaeon]
MPTVADVIIKTLVNFGVKRIYAIPGDSLNPIIDAIRRNKDIKYVQVRHEEGGALSASYESKYTGNLSACMGTSGPGSIHLLNGLYDAKTQHVPVIALTGQVETELLHHDYFQEVNLVKLFDDVSVF